MILVNEIKNKPESAMKRIGYFQNLRNLLRNCLEISWNFFRRVFLEEFLGGIFWEEFLGGIFWEDFLGGFFGRIF